jgi:hypothetical protein
MGAAASWQRQSRRAARRRGSRAPVRMALMRCRPPPGSKSGAGIQRGSAGTGESRLSPCHMPGVGDRVTEGPGVVWGFDQITSPSGTPRTDRSRQGIGVRVTSAVSREGQDGRLRGAEYQRRGGTKAHGTHEREGDAGHHERLDRPTGETVRAPTVTPPLQCMAAQAAHDPARVFTILAHRSDEDVLREAYRQTSKASAAGIDGVTAKASAAHLDAYLQDRHECLRSGRYQAPPGERVGLEQADGGQRPLGKPTFEDKISQRAVARRLEAIDAPDVYDGS